MAVKNILLAVPLTTVAGGDFLATYQAVNPGGFPKGVCIMRIINNSDSDLFISYDGSTNHDFAPMGTQFTLNAQANSQPTNNVAAFSAGTVVYIKGGSDTSTGEMYLSAYYQPQGV